MILDHGFYALLWLSFAVVHSLLADRRAKKLIQGVAGGSYRLLYNITATVHISAVLAVGRIYLLDASQVFVWSNSLNLLLTLLRVAGIVLMAASLFSYDLGRFSGLAQLRAARRGTAIDEHEALTTSGLHRYVRHPLYGGAHLFLWGGIGTEFGFATAVWGSLYLLVGTHYEERRLVAIYGDAYRDYKAKIPALIPSPWRHW